MDFFSFLRSPLCLDPLVPLDEVGDSPDDGHLPVDMETFRMNPKISDPCFVWFFSAFVLEGLTFNK